MESHTFDRIVRNLRAEASRRHMLRGLLASTALTGGIAFGAQTAHAAPRRRQRPGGPANTLVAVCHITSRRRPRRLRIRKRALRAHLAHGDFRYVDCCVNDDCDIPECFTAQCVSGTCSQTQLPLGAPCSYGAGALGNCTADGQCLPTATGGG
jgi:hypothetical protein